MSDKENYIVCSCCEEKYEPDYMIQVDEDEFICQDCEVENYCFCDECETMCHKDEVKIYKRLGVILCENCGEELPR